MRTGIRRNVLRSAGVGLLLLAYPGEAGTVSAAPDEYDPRHDPNYSRETSEKPPVNWEAIWALAREFESRAYPNGDRCQLARVCTAPQPWHYVHGASSFNAPPSVSDGPVYGDPSVGPSYGYGPLFAGWWGTSPRIPWWSLIPPRIHHRRGHHHGW